MATITVPAGDRHDLQQQDDGNQRVAEDGGDRRGRPRQRDEHPALRVRAQLRPVRGEQCQPATEGDQRRLGADRPRRATGRPGRRARPRAGCAAPSAPRPGRRPARARHGREVADRRADRQARQGQHRQRPPGRRRRPAELARQPLPDQLLQPLRPRPGSRTRAPTAAGRARPRRPAAGRTHGCAAPRGRQGPRSSPLRGGRGRGLAPRGRSSGRRARAVVRRVLVASHPGASPSSRRCARASATRRPPRSTLRAGRGAVITPGG